MIRRLRSARPSTVVMALLLLLIVLLGVRTADVRHEQQQERAQQQEQQERLEAQQVRESRALRRQVEKGTRQALGAQSSRLQEDQVQIRALAETVFTWDSASSYDEARATAKRRFGLREDGPFLTETMPPARFTVDGEGEKYSYIDTIGLKSDAGKKVEARLVSVDGGSYRYVVHLETRTTSTAAVSRIGVSPGVERPVRLEVTTDEDGTIEDLSATMSTVATRHSD